MVRLLTVPAEDELRKNTHMSRMGLSEAPGPHMFFLLQAHYSHSSDLCDVFCGKGFLQKETKLYFNDIVHSLLNNVPSPTAGSQTWLSHISYLSDVSSLAGETVVECCWC